VDICRYTKNGIFLDECIVFFIKDQPFQFLITGAVQILLDLALVAQIIIYSKGDSTKKI